MNCSSSLGSSSITWFLIPASESSNITVASGSIVNPVFTQMYRIEQPTSNDCNLILLRLNESKGGTFTCADNDNFARAELIVYSEY